MTKHTPVILSGIGLRAPHATELLDSPLKLGFIEAHSENYFGGGAARKQINELRKHYQITLHGVGLSLGRADGLDRAHLKQLKSLADEIDPLFVSEHLTWSAYTHMHVPDLLPIPFTNEAMDVFAAHVDEFQNTLQRQLLVENPSNYIAFADLDYSEPAFLAELAKRTGCGLLLDVNNVAVSAHNLGYNPQEYIDAMPQNGAVKQIHLAGYQINHIDDNTTIFLDTHSEPVYDEVWELYDYTLRRLGDVPTLIEWDAEIPALPVLIAEAHRADAIRAKANSEAKHVKAA